MQISFNKKKPSMQGKSKKVEGKEVVGKMRGGEKENANFLFLAKETQPKKVIERMQIDFGKNVRPKDGRGEKPRGKNQGRHLPRTEQNRQL